MAKDTPILKKIYDSIQELLKVNKEHKKISEKQLDKSMSSTEQRIWTIAQIALVIILGSGILISLNLFEDKTNPDYSVEVKINPEKAMLNDPNDIEFEFTFTNSGKKNITDFFVSGIDLYRQEGDKLAYKRQIVSSGNGRPYMYCGSGSRDGLDVGKKCTLKSKMISCKDCFDDKDKPVMLYIYFKSVPPIDNKIMNLTIY